MMISLLLILALTPPIASGFSRTQAAAVPVRVVVETAAGAIELEIDTVHAPATAANFLM